jgi:hypothetical protein
MSRKDEDAPVLIRNTSGKHVIWDSPESSQGPRRDGPLPDSVRFAPDGSVRMTPEQRAKMGKLPPGIVEEPYDSKKHGPKGRMG